MTTTRRLWSRYVLGFVNDIAAGFIKLDRTLPPECVGCRSSVELAKLYVLKSFHGCGIANVLMKRGLELSRRCGVSQVWLCAWAKNLRAQAFYRRWGFETVGELVIFWSDVEFCEFVMTRSLEPPSTLTPHDRKKIDAPFTSEAAIEAMVSRFEACTWPYDRWTHRAHLAVGLSYARAFSFDVALQRLRHHINLYNGTCGDPTGYNETVTVLFLRKIIAVGCQSGNLRPLQAIDEEMAQTCTVGWLYEYYSKDRIWSEEAKQTWVDPDLKQLDF